MSNMHLFKSHMKKAKLFKYAHKENASAPITALTIVFNLLIKQMTTNPLLNKRSIWMDKPTTLNKASLK